MLRPRVPAYRDHNPSGQAVLTFAGRDHYLGTFGSPAVTRSMAASSGKHRIDQQSAAPCLTVDDPIARYWIPADNYYQPTGNRPTSSTTFATINRRVCKIKRVFKWGGLRGAPARPVVRVLGDRPPL
jgi:hypothetical protein